MPAKETSVKTPRFKSSSLGGPSDDVTTIVLFSLPSIRLIMSWTETLDPSSSGSFDSSPEISQVWSECLGVLTSDKAPFVKESMSVTYWSSTSTSIKLKSLESGKGLDNHE